MDVVACQSDSPPLLLVIYFVLCVCVSVWVGVWVGGCVCVLTVPFSCY